MADLLDLIAERGEISLIELAEHFRASQATVRRDLTVLSDQGLIKRVHGGAKMATSLPERPVALRDTRAREAKLRIARAAAARVPRDRYAVALSGGTTAAGVAAELSGHGALTIVTNSLSIASMVTRYPGLKIVMTGGILRPQSLELVGVLAENTFGAINVGMAILGADGVSASAGITTFDETEARTNHAMIARAQHTVLVADSSKIGNMALAVVGTISEVDTFITDDQADPVELQRIRDAGVTVIVV